MELALVAVPPAAPVQLLEALWQHHAQVVVLLLNVRNGGGGGCGVWAAVLLERPLRPGGRPVCLRSVPQPTPHLLGGDNGRCLIWCLFRCKMRLS